MRGFSLLEVVIALLLLAVVAWGGVGLYASLLAGSRNAEGNQKVTAALATVLDFTRLQVQRRWVPRDPPDPVVRYDGQFQEYAYTVTDNGRLRDPLEAAGYLEVRKVDVELFYYLPDSSAPHVLRATQAVSR